VAEEDLRDALERARYRRVWKKPAAPGEYRVRGATYDLRLRPFVFPEHVERGGEVSATIEGGTLSTLTEGFEEPAPARDPARRTGAIGRVFRFRAGAAFVRCR